MAMVENGKVATGGGVVETTGADALAHDDLFLMDDGSIEVVPLDDHGDNLAGAAGKSIPPFVVKLMAMLNDRSTDELISWSEVRFATYAGAPGAVGRSSFVGTGRMEKPSRSTTPRAWPAKCSQNISSTAILPASCAS
jgi:hypothetical protein